MSKLNPKEKGKKEGKTKELRSMKQKSDNRGEKMRLKFGFCKEWQYR